MGCCVSRSGASDSDDMENAITIGKNRPLIQERIKWKSDVPMTEGQLRSKRDEFWETAPAFEGRKEIWDALKAASALAEQGDYALSQAILDGANVALPDGTLRECYDELGNRYQIPYYCLSAPTNLLEEKSSESSGGTMNGDGPYNSLRAGSSNTGSAGASLGDPLTLKLRLSTTGEDVGIDCYTRETVHMVKHRLHQIHDLNIPLPNQQRWLFGGRILLDKMRIGDCKIPQNFVVQVVIHSNGNGKTNGDQEVAQNVDGNCLASDIAKERFLEVHSPAKCSSETKLTPGETKLSPGEAKPVDQPRSLPVSPVSNDHPAMDSEVQGSTTTDGRVSRVEKRTSSGPNAHTGSSSSRKSSGKHRQHSGKTRARKTHSASVNSTNSSSIMQTHCTSLSTNRNAESPTPVEDCRNR